MILGLLIIQAIAFAAETEDLRDCEVQVTPPSAQRLSHKWTEAEVLQALEFLKMKGTDYLKPKYLSKQSDPEMDQAITDVMGFRVTRNGLIQAVRKKVDRDYRKVMTRIGVDWTLVMRTDHRWEKEEVLKAMRFLKSKGTRFVAPVYLQKKKDTTMDALLSEEMGFPCTRGGLYQAIGRLFDGYKELLIEIGVDWWEVKNIAWTRESLLAAFQYLYEHDRPLYADFYKRGTDPRIKDILKEALGFPVTGAVFLSAVRKHFNTWEGGLRAAGIDPDEVAVRPTEWTLRIFVKRLSLWENWLVSGQVWPPPVELPVHLWPEEWLLERLRLLDAEGMLLDPKTFTNDLSDLNGILARVEPQTTISGLMITLKQRYLSWREALVAAGVDPIVHLGREGPGGHGHKPLRLRTSEGKKWNSRRVVELIQFLSGKEFLLSWSEMMEKSAQINASLSRLPDPVSVHALYKEGLRYFGTWVAALEAAGLDASQIVQKVRQKTVQPLETHQITPSIVIASLRMLALDKEFKLIKAFYRGELGKRVSEALMVSTYPMESSTLFNAAVRHFGTLFDALTAAKLDPYAHLRMPRGTRNQDVSVQRERVELEDRTIMHANYVGRPERSADEVMLDNWREGIIAETISELEEKDQGLAEAILRELCTNAEVLDGDLVLNLRRELGGKIHPSRISEILSLLSQGSALRQLLFADE